MLILTNNLLVPCTRSRHFTLLQLAKQRSLLFSLNSFLPTWDISDIFAFLILLFESPSKIMKMVYISSQYLLSFSRNLGFGIFSSNILADKIYRKKSKINLKFCDFSSFCDALCMFVLENTLCWLSHKIKIVGH